MKDRKTVRQQLANHLRKKFASGGFRNCGGPGQPPCKDSTSNITREPRAVIGKANRAPTPEEIAAERKAVRLDSNASPLNQFGSELFDSKNWNRDEMARASKGLESSYRVSDKPNVFDDYLNPASWVGGMAASLGQSPQKAKEDDSILPYIKSIAEPVIGGAISGIFPKSAGKIKTSTNANSVASQGMDGNFITKPLTPFTRNEIATATGQEANMAYRKIGNQAGLKDLIEKGGSQAPAPFRMKSGSTIDTPFFGIGKKPVESYKGLYAVETNPLNPKYKYSNNVGGTSNYGVAPFDRVTGAPIKNIPLEDLEVYRRKWFSNNYKKLDKNNLESGLDNAGLQIGAENTWKWGSRGAIVDEIFNDGEYTDKIIKSITDNKMALGGPKQSNMNELLSEINTGGSHEMNPNGGVPIGKGNTVEQGETMTKDYVFSDRLFLTEPDLKRYNLPKKLKGKSIADASKILAGISKESNAAVDKQTAEDMLERLKGVNEEMKGPVEEEAQGQAPQGQQFFLGGDKLLPGEQGGIPGMDMLGAAGTALEFGNQMFGDTGIDTSGKMGYNDVKVGGEALGSAMKGAQAGMALGPWGAAIGGVVGGVSGLIGGNRKKREAEEANHNFSQAQNSKYRQSDFAMGGKKYAGGGDKNPDPYSVNALMNLVNNPNGAQSGGLFDMPFDMSTGSRNPGQPGRIDPTPQLSRVETSSTGLTPIRETYEGVGGTKTGLTGPTASLPNPMKQGPTEDPRSIFGKLGDWMGEKENQDKLSSKANTALRYAPVLTNYLQYKNIDKPEYESLNRLDSKYQKDYVDETSLVNQAKESESSTRRALKESSGGDMGALRTNLLASHLNSIKGRSDAFLQAENINRGENQTAQQFNQRTGEVNLNQSNAENDINARNIAAYDNNRSKLMSAIGEGIGNIGLENERKKYPERAGLLYDFLGDYLNKNKEKETV